MHQKQDDAVPQDATQDTTGPDAMRLGAIESADPTLTPLLAVIVSRFMRSEPLPAH